MASERNRQTVSFEELAYSNMITLNIQSEDLILRVLDRSSRPMYQAYRLQLRARCTHYGYG
jgi:hypothetical protein